MSRTASFTFVVGCILALPGVASAQSPWLGVDRSARVAAEWYRPGFNNQDHLKAASSALYLSGRARVTEAVALVGEMPLALGGYKYDNDASLQAGNPYIGLEAGRTNQPVWVEMGARLPLIGSDANSGVAVGLYSDIERPSAFIPECFALSGALNVGARAPSGLGFRLRAGPEVLVPTNSHGGESESETLINYGAQVSQVTGPWELSLHAGGTWIATESGNFGERSMHQVGAGVSYATRTVRPGFTFRLPLDKDMTDVLDYVVGITLQVPLR